MNMQISATPTIQRDLAAPAAGGRDLETPLSGGASVPTQLGEPVDLGVSIQLPRPGYYGGGAGGATYRPAPAPVSTPQEREAAAAERSAAAAERAATAAESLARAAKQHWWN